MSAISFSTLLPYAGDSLQTLIAKICDGKRTREGTALASASRTTSTFSATIINPDCSKMILMCNITVPGGNGVKLSYVPTDPLSATEVIPHVLGVSYETTATLIFAYFGSFGVVNFSGHLMTSCFPPRTFRVYVPLQNTNAITYSVSYVLIP